MEGQAKERVPETMIQPSEKAGVATVRKVDRPGSFSMKVQISSFYCTFARLLSVH